jgi:hypothetical protein
MHRGQRFVPDVDSPHSLIAFVKCGAGKAERPPRFEVMLLTTKGVQPGAGIFHLVNLARQIFATDKSFCQ